MNVARRAIDAIPANATAAPIFAAGGMGANEIKQLAHGNPAYVALGAIGPDLFFLLPDYKPGMGSMIWKLAITIRDTYTWWDEHFLGAYEDALGPVGNNLSDEINALTGGLKDQIMAIFGEAISFLKDTLLKLLLEEYDAFALLSSGVQSAYDEQTFFWADMLHYRQTYRFGAALWQRASDPAIVPDAVQRARFQAYALGWMSHLATDVTGHPFVNAKSGGPFRTHWQRHHLVENHMDALVYNTDHGTQAIYDQMANSALHLWISFKDDGSSTNDFFQQIPGAPYPTGDHSADVNGRHEVWDVDSEIPPDLAQFLSDTMKAVFKGDLTTSDNGMISCCPTIISTIANRSPLETGGFAEKEDIEGAYWWLSKLVKMLTTDYYKIRRPEFPDPVVIPSFPTPPGTGPFDAGPGDGDFSVEDVFAFLVSLLAWAEYIAEVLIWPAAVVAGIVGGALTFPLRAFLYEYFELPLYNLWLGVHTYFAMTGYVMPMPGELNAGLNTLGVSTADNWATTIVALGDPDGGITPGTVMADPSGGPRAAYPKDVLLDPPSFINSILNTIITPGPPAVNGELPSEFVRPWRFPLRDNQGNLVGTEQPATSAGPFHAGMNANALFGAMPGSPVARTQLEGAQSESDTISKAFTLLQNGLHMGDPQDYTAYVIARLTRDGLDLDDIANFNLDADRGYGYLTWDWVRDPERKSIPDSFKDDGDPSHGGTTTDVSQHKYPTPVQAGYGWNPADQVSVAGQTPLPGFDPNDRAASVRIRYIDRERKFS